MVDWNDYIKTRDHALAKLDMSWARKMMPDASDDGVRLIAMHKARLEIIDMPADLRKDSARFLHAHGLTRVTGEPADPDHLP